MLLCVAPQASAAAALNDVMKMNNQDMERFDKQIENMYSILVNISSELINIKGMMQANKRHFPETVANMPNNARTDAMNSGAAFTINSVSQHSTRPASTYNAQRNLTDEG